MKWRVVLLLLLGLAALVVIRVQGRDPSDEEGAVPMTERPSGDAVAPPGLVGRVAPEATDGGSANARAPVPVTQEAKPWTVSATVKTTTLDHPCGWDHESQPIEGALVRIWLRVGESREEVGTGETGADGHVEIDLERLARMSRSQLALGGLMGSASAPGHCQGRGGRSTIYPLLDADLRPLPWSMEFCLVPSVLVVGQVLADDGEPLSHVPVRLETPSGERVRAFGLSGSDGRYVIPVPRAGEFQVCGFRDDVKSGCTGPFHVSATTDSEAPTLRLERKPAKEGAIRFADGAPVAGLSFQIDHPGFHEGGSIGLPPAGSWPPWDPFIDVTTDEEGSFHVVFPVTSSEELMARYLPVIPGVEPTDTGFDANAPTLHITIRRHRLRIRLRDEHGEPLRDQEVSLYLEGGDPDAVAASTDANGEVSLFAPAGSRGLLRLVAAGNAVHRREVEIPETGNESIVTIDVPDRTTSGTLAFAVDVAHEIEVYPMRLRIGTPDGYVVTVRDLEGPSDRVGLPPGAYTVDLWFVPPHTFGREAPTTRAGLSVPSPVAVRDGATSVLDVAWTNTAALGFRVEVAGAAIGTPMPGRAWVEGPTGQRRPLALQDGSYNDRPALFVGEWLYSAWRLPPGPCRLVLEAQGFRTAIRAVTLVDRQLTRVEVEMKREP